MKLWITRPHSDEIYMGGDRSLRLWTTQPIFDHRPLKHDFDLCHKETGDVFESVYLELGWSSENHSVKATPFLKQDRSVFDRVWELVFASVAPASDPDLYRRNFNVEEYARLIEPRYEMECLVHWKRFLVELDMKSDTVSLIEANSLVSDDDYCFGRPVTENLGLTSLYLDEDLNRPFFYSDYPDYDCDRSGVF